MKLNEDYFFCFGCGATGDVIERPEDEWDDRFVEACQMLDHIEYLADILTVGDLEERVAVVDKLMKEGQVAFLQDYVAQKRKEEAHHEQRSNADFIC